MSNYLKSVNIQFVPSDTGNSCPNNLQFSLFLHHTSHMRPQIWVRGVLEQGVVCREEKSAFCLIKKGKKKTL